MTARDALEQAASAESQGTLVPLRSLTVPYRFNRPGCRTSVQSLESSVPTWKRGDLRRRSGQSFLMR